MSKPTWDETEELENDIPSFDETEELEPISKTETALRSGGQGLTLGFMDEIMAALGTKGASPRQVVENPKQAIETEKQMMKDYESNLKEERAKIKAAEEANPNTALAAELVGGVLPGLASGGGSIAAGVAQSGTKLGAKEAMKYAAKEGGKLGAKYGTVSGVGYSEGETPIEVAEDAAIGASTGALGGALLPVGVEGTKRAVGSVTGGVRDLLKHVPGSKTISSGYKYGKQGKGISTENLDDDLADIAGGILDNLKTKKKANDLINMKKDLDKLGFKVNTKEAVESAIEDLEKIQNKDFLNMNNKEVLPKIKAFAGIDPQEEKLAEKAIKNVIKKQQQLAGKEKESLIKAEKSLAKNALKKGDVLEEIENSKTPMDDLLSGLRTPEGAISTTSGKFKTPLGKEYSKKLVDDVTDYQPSIVNKTTQDGRPLVTTEDLGTGKIQALVGDIQKKVDVDLENMSLEDVDVLRGQLNEITGLAKNTGSTKDPVMQQATKLAIKLKELSDNVITEMGDNDLLKRRETFSNIFSGEQALGIDGKLNPNNMMDRYEKVTKLSDMLGTEGGIRKRRNVQLSEKLLGEDVITPKMKKQLDIIKSLSTATKEDAEGNISRTGLYKQAIGFIPNVGGRVVGATSKIASPVIKATRAVTDLSKEQLESFGNSLARSENKGTQIFGNRILETLSKEDGARSQAIWALSQSPAFREMVKRYAPKADEDLSNLDDLLFDNQEEDVNSELKQDSMVIEPISEEERQQKLDDTVSEIDRVNQQQSSGDDIPMSQLDSLLGKIAMLDLPEDQIDELEEDATNMSGFADGQQLKEKIKKLQRLT